MSLRLALLTLAAFALRLLHLTRHEIWVDEAATWWFGRLAAQGSLEVALEPTPPLYYGLIGLLTACFGESDFVLRLPSAIFGALAVPVVWKLGRTLAGIRVAWLAAGLLALHPVHVYFSREARVYPLLLLLTLLVALTLWQFLQSGSTKHAAGLSLLLVLSCYSHFYGMFLIATCAAVIILIAREKPVLIRGFLACVVAGLLFLPYLLASLPHLRTSGAAWSVESLYRDLPQERSIARVAEAQFFGAEYHKYTRGLAQPAPPSLLRIAALILQCGLLLLVVLSLREEKQRRATLFLGLFWILPLAIPWTINHQRAIFQTVRHDVYVLGFTCLLLAFGLDRFARLRRPLAYLAVGILVLAGGFRLLAIHFQPVSSYHQETGHFLAEHVGPKDRVFAMGIRRLITEHYARLAGTDAPLVSFPSGTDAHPGWSDVETLLQDEPALHSEGRETVANLEARRVFLLMRRYERTADTVSANWLVDRHLVENLLVAGWTKNESLSSTDLNITVFDAPR